MDLKGPADNNYLKINSLDECIYHTCISWCVYTLNFSEAFMALLSWVS